MSATSRDAGSGDDGGSGEEGGERPGRARRSTGSRWWVAALTFVVGLLVGVVVTGLLAGGGSDVGAAGEPTSSPSPGASASASQTPSGGVTGEAVVNQACLSALNDAQDAASAVQGLGTSLGDLDFGALDGVVRQLQPLQARLTQSLQDCNVTTRLPDGSTTTGLPTAVPTSASS